MPQAVEAYVNGKDYLTIDEVKQDILNLYYKDIKKYDNKNDGKTTSTFSLLAPSLSNHNSIFKLSKVNKKARYREYRNSFNFLEESMIVNICYNISSPEVIMELYCEKEKFKMYMGDTGLLISLILNSEKDNANNLYASLISDNLSINEGIIFENMVAQMLRANKHQLYFHEFLYTPENTSTEKKYEVDFLLVNGKRITPIEVKSANFRSHKSFDHFKQKYQLKLPEKYIIYTKDLDYKDNIYYIPIYMTMCL